MGGIVAELSYLVSPGFHRWRDAKLIRQTVTSFLKCAPAFKMNMSETSVATFSKHDTGSIKILSVQIVEALKKIIARIVRSVLRGFRYGLLWLHIIRFERAHRTLPSQPFM